MMTVTQIKRGGTRIRAFLLGTLAVLLFFPSIAQATSLVFPKDHHFIFERGFFSIFKARGKNAKINIKVFNGSDHIKTLSARARVCTLGQYGEPINTDEFLKVEPEEVDIYPQQERMFGIIFPLNKGDSNIPATALLQS